MPGINLTPNGGDDDYIHFHIEAAPEDDEEEAGLIITVEGSDIFERDVDSIEEFRDMVVKECDDAIKQILDRLLTTKQLGDDV
jgi:hypothetical protein